MSWLKENIHTHAGVMHRLQKTHTHTHTHFVVSNKRAPSNACKEKMGALDDVDWYRCQVRPAPNVPPSHQAEEEPVLNLRWQAVDPATETEEYPPDADWRVLPVLGDALQ